MDQIKSLKPSVLVLLAVLVFFSQGIVACEKRGVVSDPRTIPITTPLPKEGRVYPIAIIGAGAAGTMAVQRAVLSNDEVILFTGSKQERRRSRGHWVRTVDNIPGLENYERAILELRNETLTRLAQSPLADNLYVVQQSVYSIQKEGEFFKLEDDSGKTYYAAYVVLATGMMDEQPHIQGSIRPILKYANGQTVVYCPLCDGHRTIGKKTAVIGYSSAAAQNAITLVERYQLPSMTLLTNGHEPNLPSALLQKMADKNIRIVKEPILEVLGSKARKQLSGFKLESGEVVAAEIAFVSLGIRPNNQLAVQLNANVDAKGLVITDSNGESSIPNLFVIGDLRSGSLKQIYTAWQHAVDALQVINCRIREE